MIDCRKLQRALFRMQLDPAFAAAMMGGDAAAEKVLGVAERELLKTADIAGILADHGGRRRAQILGNIASEYVLTLAEAARCRLGLDVLHEFPSSDAFHGAIRAEEPLPLAFGAWLRAKSAAFGCGVAAALAALEAAMATARREVRPALAPARGEIAMSPGAWLVTLPDGAFDHAQAVRAALDAGRATPPPPQMLETRAAEWLTSPERGAAADPAAAVSPRPETVLLVVQAEGEGHRLREVAAERLEPDVALLLRAAASPLGATALLALAEQRDWQPAEVQGFVEQLVADRVLRLG